MQLLLIQLLFLNPIYSCNDYVQVYSQWLRILVERQYLENPRDIIIEDFEGRHKQELEKAKFVRYRLSNGLIIDVYNDKALVRTKRGEIPFELGSETKAYVSHKLKLSFLFTNGTLVVIDRYDRGFTLVSPSNVAEIQEHSKFPIRIGRVFIINSYYLVVIGNDGIITVRQLEGESTLFKILHRNSILVLSDDLRVVRYKDNAVYVVQDGHKYIRLSI